MAFSNNYSGRNYSDPQPVVKVRVRIDQVCADLFSEKAREAAQACSQKTKINTTAQLRRFYDELVMWHDKVLSSPAADEQKKRFERCEPYIQMLRAKAAYARGRGLVDDVFYEMFDGLVEQIKSTESLKTARLFMEAFMGFKKYYEKSNK